MALMSGFHTDHKSVIEFKGLDVLRSRFTESMNLPFQGKRLILIGHVHAFSLSHSSF